MEKYTTGTEGFLKQIADAYALGRDLGMLFGKEFPDGKFSLGQRVRKIKGSSWQGRVVGFYSTELTPMGYAVESEREPGSVQIYPEAALEAVS